MIDESTLQKLEFGRIRELLAAECSCSLGKKMALRLKPATSVSVVRHWLLQVEQMSSIAEKQGLAPMAGVRDITDSVKKSERPSGLTADELAGVAETFQATGQLQRWFAQLPEECEALRALSERVGDFTSIAEEIGKCIDPRGRVVDEASPKLKSIRQAIIRTRNQIDVVFERLLRQNRIVRVLQYPNLTFHEDRRVLPLKAEQRGRVPGIIHRSSDSGQTLFVEPAEAVELNNAVMRLRDDESKEISAILSQLSRLVFLNEQPILASLEAMTVLDLICAKVRYARKWGAICPEIRDDFSLSMTRARHPVLLDLFANDGSRREVVPIDVRLGLDFDLLMITGPNTGGKTVAIKTIGLLAAMVQAGIPVPVERGSTFPVYRTLLMDIGDEQSLQQSLSTFSSHLSNMLSIIKRAGEGALVLLDELGAGTDPDEGAAIGRAIVDELLRLKCSAVVSTHLSALKAVAFNVPRVDNACVEFDVETLRPTYRLKLGEPGNSNALIIAHRLGMPKRLVDLARFHLDHRHRDLHRAIAGTLDSRRRAEQALSEASQARREAEEAKRLLDEEQKRLAVQQSEYESWVRWINRLSSGDRVHLKSFDKPGRLVRVQLHKQTAVVSTGALELEVKLTELQPMKNQ